MRTHTAGRRIARSAALSLRSIWNRALIAHKDALDVRLIARSRRRSPTVRERREELIRFYDKFEALIDVLCEGAQYGPMPHLELRYVQLRTWFVSHYPRVQPFVASFLGNDAEQNDAFLALIQGESLLETLESDDGSMICRINRAREALNLYAEHLRQLASRKG